MRASTSSPQRAESKSDEHTASKPHANDPSGPSTRHQGGYVFAELGRLPRRGDAITSGSYSIRVESVRENRIESIRVRERRHGPSSEAERQDDDGA